MAYIKLKNGSVNEIPDTPDWEKRFKADLEPDGAVYCDKKGGSLKKGAKSKSKPKSKSKDDTPVELKDSEEIGDESFEELDEELEK